jgi:RNA polymerase sigma factor (sigma-70 family)
MYTPFLDRGLENKSPEASDEQLAERAQAGDRGALEQLAVRHQPWIYNIVVRMVWFRDDAQELTQDILVKMITGLPSFRGESRFRTWLYRVAVNHIFNFKKQRENEPFETYEDFAYDLEQTPDLDPLDPNSPVTNMLVQEAKILCTMAMLLCLTGRQRVVFILGEVFGVTDSMGAEVLGMSKTNFRQVLARARHNLYSFMAGSCGLINQANSCRCKRKLRGFIEKGYMTPDRLRFAEGHQFRVQQIAPSRAHELKEVTARLHAALFQEHPFLSIDSKLDLVRRALETAARGPSE